MSSYLLVTLVDTCSHEPWIAWDILLVMSTVAGNLCNKCPKQLVKQKSSSSDYFNAISEETSKNSDICDFSKVSDIGNECGQWEIYFLNYFS